MPLHPIVGRLNQKVACVNSRTLCEDPDRFRKLATCAGEARNPTLEEYVARWGEEMGRYWYERYVSYLPPVSAHRFPQLTGSGPLVTQEMRKLRSHKLCNSFSELPARCAADPQVVLRNHC